MDASVLGLGRDTPPHVSPPALLCFCSGPRKSRRGWGSHARQLERVLRQTKQRGGLAAGAVMGPTWRACWPGADTGYHHTFGK